MANTGNMPDIDLNMPGADLGMPGPGADLELPGPSLGIGLDLPDVKPAFDLPDLKLDAPLEPAATIAPGKSAAPADPKGGKGGKKKKKEKPARARKAKGAGPKMPGLSARAILPVAMSLLSIVILLVMAGVMYLFDVPVNAVPDLSLATYVEGLWLVIGCLFVVAMLEDIKTALILTGIDLAMLATVFPTLWLLLDLPMNPLYFFVLGMVVLLAIVALPLSLTKARKPAGKAKAPATAGAAATTAATPAGTPAGAQASKGPRITS